MNKMKEEAQPGVSSIVKIFQSGFLVREPSHTHNVCDALVAVSPCHWPSCGIIGEKLLLRSQRK